MCFRRDSNPGPNLMAAVSCGTGLFLGGKFQAIGESAIACAEKALSGDNNERWFYHIFFLTLSAISKTVIFYLNQINIDFI